MIDHELLFLGLLMNGPKHGYEIKRQIEEDLLPNIGLGIKSIYYPLQKMAEEGFIEKEVGRQGKFPEKQVYRITTKGKAKFGNLIEESFVSIERPFFQMNLSLYFLPLVDKDIARHQLKARLVLLKRIVRQLEAIKAKIKPKSSSKYLILEHDLDLVLAEVSSTQKLISQI